jgi:hypothetical protein
VSDNVVNRWSSNTGKRAQVLGKSETEYAYGDALAAFLIKYVHIQGHSPGRSAVILLRCTKTERQESVAGTGGKRLKVARNEKV